MAEYPKAPGPDETGHGLPRRTSRDENLGLVQLIPPEGGNSHHALDIVAVHGKGAHPAETWTTKSPEGEYWMDWLKDRGWLPSELPDARIMRYGYNCDYFGRTAVDKSPMNVAEDFLRELNKARLRSPKRPLIIIAHSFGGLVVAEAFHHSRMDENRWPGIYTSTVGLVFLGTPFRGTAELQHDQLLHDIQKVFPPERIMLRNNSASKGENLWLEEIHKNFCQALAGRPTLNIACFWETLPTNLSLSVRKVLETGDDEPGGEPPLRKRRRLENSHITLHVNQTSACLDPIRATIRSYSRDCDHLGMNKFKSNASKDWKTFVEALKGMYLQQEEITRLVLEGLRFPGMEGRFSKLDGPLEGTYDWIMDEELPSSRLSTSVGIMDEELPSSRLSTSVGIMDAELPFSSRLSTPGVSPNPLPAWLRTQSGSCLILGKAGSGKSTLLKYIIRHKQTNLLLDQWATDLGCRLLKANFFFFRAGESLESSRKGMVRSLLHQILSQLPEWTPVVLPTRFLPQASGPSEQSSCDWKDQELFGALSKLVDQANATNVCLCIFLDGLDEHKDSAEHEALVEDLANLLHSERIKICATSRPRDLFQGRLGLDGQCIVLEEHTGPDLRQFVADELGKSGNFRKLERLDQAGVEGLIAEIQRKAHGVFLWVVLAVKELHRELGQYHNSHDIQLVDLRERLKHLPDSLREYIKRIIDNTDEYHRGFMARLLLLMQLNHHPIPTLAVKFLEEDLRNDDFTSWLLPLNKFQFNHFDNRGSMLARQWGTDLVEVQKEEYCWYGPDWPPIQSVRFAHRSVSEYLDSDEAYYQLTQDAKRDLGRGQDFDEYFTLCKIYSADFKVKAHIAFQTGLNDRNGEMRFFGWSEHIESVMTIFYVCEQESRRTPEAVIRDFTDVYINEVVRTSFPSEQLALIEDNDMREAVTLSLAATYGLTLFFERRLSSTRYIHPHLLDAVMWRIGLSLDVTDVARLYNNKFSILEALLSQLQGDLNSTTEPLMHELYSVVFGCDEGNEQKHKGLTIWESFLHMLVENSKHRMLRRCSANQLLAILQLCLGSGAKLRDCRFSSGFSRLDSVLAHSLGSCADPAGADLEELRELLERYGLNCSNLREAWDCAIESSKDVHSVGFKHTCSMAADA